MNKNIIDLSTVATCDLVKELSKREGVEQNWIDPYAKYCIEGEGPACVLVVID